MEQLNGTLHANISDFAEGDIITRAIPAQGDSWLMGVACELLALSTAVILIRTIPECHVFSLPPYFWAHGWERYPLSREDILRLADKRIEVKLPSRHVFVAGSFDYPGGGMSLRFKPEGE